MSRENYFDRYLQMQLKWILLAALALVVVATFGVTSTKEGYGDATSDAAGSSAEGKGDDAKASADAEDASRFNDLVFKAYMQVHGVPPLPPVSKHYAALARTGNLEQPELEQRLRKDMRGGGEGGEGEAKPEAKPDAKPAKDADDDKSDEQMDVEMRALRQRVEAADKMSAPVRAPPGHDGAAMAQRLREMSSQISMMAKQYDVPVRDPAEPRAFEPFMAF